jgi:hypothetical protein
MKGRDKGEGERHRDQKGERQEERRRPRTGSWRISKRADTADPEI